MRPEPRLGQVERQSLSGGLAGRTMGKGGGRPSEAERGRGLPMTLEDLSLCGVGPQEEEG